LIFSFQGVLSQSVQRVFTAISKYNVLSTAHKEGRRGVVEDKALILGKKRTGFLFYQV